MKLAKTFEEFISLNPDDIPKIILSKFRWKLEERNMELGELVNDFYAEMIRTNICAKYDPTKNTKFSTYMFSCLRNFVLEQGKSNQAKASQSALSLNAMSEDGSSPLDILEDESGYAESYFLDKEIRKVLGNFKGNMKTFYLTIYGMIKLGMNDSEIADELGFTSTHIGNHRKVMMEYLRKHLNEER